MSAFLTCQVANIFELTLYNRVCNEFATISFPESVRFGKTVAVLLRCNFCLDCY